jgi:transcriptional regulator with XRE-family HTH domain
MLGLSQEKLGEALGLTFQQVQKYERGTNRIGASRLLEIAHVLDVPVAFFYDDVDPVRAPPIPRGSDEFGVFESEGDYLRQEETVELVTAYYTITDDKVRRNLFGLAKALWEVDNPSVKKARKAQRRSVHIPSHQPAKP